jgi:hypothetical protein
MQNDKERTDIEQARDESRETDRGSMSSEELDQQQASDLPDRDAMSLVNLNAAVPINAAIAANVLSDNSSALAGAIQDTPIDQST